MIWIPLIAMCLVVFASSAPGSQRMGSDDSRLKFLSLQHLEMEWRAFKINYNKTYQNTVEEIHRKKIFADQLVAIDAHNRLYSEGLTSFTMGINSFSDLEHSEFLNLMTGYRSDDPPFEDFFSDFVFEPEINITSPIPKQVDWRRKGYVTSVKNQGQCGSCWAFGATGTLEGQHARKTGRLVSLSEQQLVDCSTANHGCRGGWPYTALKYIASNEGIDTEASYPYTARDEPCRFNQTTIGATCKRYVTVAKAECALERAVATVGPISVAIDSSQRSFQSYRSGIYNEPRCSDTRQTHAVLVVGYGQRRGAEYWIVKNSWGTQWGMGGYIWMSRNRNNQCGIVNNAVYPVV